MADILIVDDEEDIRSLISDILKDEGYTTQTASNAAQALGCFDSGQVPKAMILDIWLEGSDLDGLGVLKAVKSRYPNLPVVMISGHGNIETAVRSIRLGAYDFIEKPFKAEKLLIVLQRALENSNLVHINTALQERQRQITEILGNSRLIQVARGAALTAAPSNSRVFISGEPGTGKEALALSIHHASKRVHKPFVVLNVANLPPEQLEGELFGSYSPDKGYNRGAIEVAEGGTLFIDEAAGMPLSTQTTLLNFMQQNSYQRIGSKDAMKADVRIISASSADISSALETGTLQKSLYYRLSVVPIKMPALRERREDIKVLVEHFLRQFAGENPAKRLTISEEAYAVLHLYDWPGNVRQLRNIVEWIAMMSQKGAQQVVEMEHIPQDILDSVQDKHRSLNPLHSDIISKKLKQARDIFEKQYITAQLERFGGNISKTAQFIGMDRTALHRKLRLLQISVVANDSECA